MYFPYFVIISAWKGCGPSFEQTFTQGCFVPSLVETDTVVLEKKMIIWKIYDNNDIDDDGQQTNCVQKSSDELKTLLSFVLSTTVQCDAVSIYKEIVELKVGFVVMMK